jgi:hypothetical protein
MPVTSFFLEPPLPGDVATESSSAGMVFAVPFPPISGRTGGWGRHGRGSLVQTVRGIHVETSKGLPIYLSVVKVSRNNPVNASKV